jgi:hypothetical protein
MHGGLFSKEGAMQMAEKLGRIAAAIHNAIVKLKKSGRS